jgi:hypothetical protein
LGEPEVNQDAIPGIAGRAYLYKRAAKNIEFSRGLGIGTGFIIRYIEEKNRKEKTGQIYGHSNGQMGHSFVHPAAVGCYEYTFSNICKMRISTGRSECTCWSVGGIGFKRNPPSVTY